MMHASRPRNRLIAQALYDRGVIEHYGRGIKRIKEECDRNGNPHPDWTDRPGEFLTIYKARGGEEVQTGKHRELNEGNEGNREGNEGNLERVFNAIKSNPHATIAELENVLGVSSIRTDRCDVQEIRCVQGRNLRYNTCVNLQKESEMRYSGTL